MSQVLTRDQARDLDAWALRELAIPGCVLMENAGRGAAELLLALGVRGPVAVWCGKGNNGGDGSVLARHLWLRGVEVRVRLFADPAELQGDAVAPFQGVRRLGIPCDVMPPSQFDPGVLRKELGQSEWLVDGLFGTGFRGPMQRPYADVVEIVNRLGPPVLALDVPSGLDADTGLPQAVAVRAGHVATFAALKPGLLAPAAREYVGKVHVVGIGVARPT